MSKTIVLFYPNMSNGGGIERYIYEFAKKAVTDGYRVIWLCDERYKVWGPYSNFLLSDKIERVKISITYFLKLTFVDDFVIKDYERVIVYTFNSLEMLIADNTFKSKKNIISVLTIPSNASPFVFLEWQLKGIKKRILKELLAKQFNQWNKSFRLFAFNAPQFKALEENYGIEVGDYQGKIFHKVGDIETLDENLLKMRSAKRQENFSIISIGRFDFPHKGYLLGLVRSYGKLKEKYPFIKLLIVGGGPDKDRLIQEIDKLEAWKRNDICLLGELSPETVSEYLIRSNLNVSVAGAALDGASKGVLSLPARNFFEDRCEVYGFFSNAEQTMSLRSGDNVDDFIECAINMSDEEYIRHSYEGYYASKVFFSCKTPYKLFDKEIIKKNTLLSKKVLFVYWFAIHLDRFIGNNKK